tara:strand:+ start:584 stop:904 length:321 start_codon:yes stop_codon:yes gene_type:complete
MTGKERSKEYALQGCSSYDSLPMMHQKQILVDYFDDLGFEAFNDLISQSHESVKQAFKSAVTDHPRVAISLIKSVAYNYLVKLIDKDLECSRMAMKDNKEVNNAKD